MSQPILIVCGKDQTGTTIQMSLGDLCDAEARYPELAYFLGNHPPIRVNTAAFAKSFLSDRPDPTATPVLIVIDALVRESDEVNLVVEGSAAIGLMDWLDEYRPRIPVLTVAATPTEKVERRVVARANAALWRMNVSDASGRRDVLAETLAGIVPEDAQLGRARQTRHITIDVRRNSACYRLSNGRYEFLSSNPIAYAHDKRLDRLIDKIERLTPWPNEASGRPYGDWYERVIDVGGALYELLMRDTVGVHVKDLLRNPSNAPDGTPPSVDLSFEIDSEDNDYVNLFKLPFELLNDSAYDGVMCSRVPMVRRLRIKRTDAYAEVVPPPPHAPLRVLFMDANVSGNVRLRKRQSPLEENARTFARLSTADKELAILEHFARSLGAERMATPEVIGRPAGELVGAALCDSVRAKLLEGHYDLFHFCGHSATLDDGQTYLIFPGESGKAEAVPIGYVAEWLRMGHTRMVVLSSCEGASAMTALETMRVGVERMLGFRWKVEEDMCVEYFRRFYEKYLVDQNLCESYRFACNELRLARDGSPAWASALAVQRD
ncbi:CHAT domain-containing protein [Trinickia violacea]|uniref:CHAT domain-containing protein n=1 Tax=Trinickia violacea TaxID=2571746 RepID=A0A4P8IWA3_9BURK|nr:CHAT domain-containing protein [Trinickia violacea]QCP52771.1 CHAT domain-containing protein [Trinickia violacea]